MAANKKARAANLAGLRASAGRMNGGTSFAFSGGGGSAPAPRQGAHGGRSAPAKPPRRKSAQALLDSDAFSFEAWLREQWRFIPLRLDDAERGQLLERIRRQKRQRKLQQKEEKKKRKQERERAKKRRQRASLSPEEVAALNERKRQHMRQQYANTNFELIGPVRESPVAGQSRFLPV